MWICRDNYFLYFTELKETFFIKQERLAASDEHMSQWEWKHVPNACKCFVISCHGYCFVQVRVKGGGEENSSKEKKEGKKRHRLTKGHLALKRSFERGIFGHNWLSGGTRNQKTWLLPWGSGLGTFLSKGHGCILHFQTQTTRFYP